MKNKILNITRVLFFIVLIGCDSKKQEIENKGDIVTTIKLKKTASDIFKRLKAPSKDYVLVVAHRGDWRYAPENSLEAIRRCIDIGVDIVEIDVRLTKDDHLVVIHDKTLDRTTNGSGKVKDFTLKEIKKLRLRSGCGIIGSKQQVPTLEEVMLLAKDKIMVNLDKTEGKTIREAYAILKKTGTIDQAIFKGNDPYEVMYGKYGSLMDSIIYMPKLWYKNKEVISYTETYEKTIDPFIYEILFDSEDAETFKMIPDLIERNNKFLAISLWDELCAGHTDEKALLENPDVAWGWLIDQGANAIMTDRPSELIAYLQDKGLHD